MKTFETPETGNTLSSNDAILSLIKEERLKKMGMMETPEDSTNMSNNDTIRYLLRRENLKLWQLADAMEVSEATVTRMMRHEIPDDKFSEIISLIRTMRNRVPE